MQINNGWLTEAKHVPSPFYDARPDNEMPSLLVIHNISLPPEQFGGPYIEQLFTGQLDPNIHPYFKTIYQLKVSAHCLIRRTGEIIQFVDFTKRAWHCGISSFSDRERCNDFSIGIELEGSDTQPFTEEQYGQLARLTQLLITHYSITKNAIVGHSDIAPNRKTDPGPFFDWRHYFKRL